MKLWQYRRRNNLTDITEQNKNLEMTIEDRGEEGG